MTGHSNESFVRALVSSAKVDTASPGAKARALARLHQDATSSSFTPRGGVCAFLAALLVATMGSDRLAHPAASGAAPLTIPGLAAQAPEVPVTPSRSPGCVEAPVGLCGQVVGGGSSSGGTYGSSGGDVRGSSGSSSG